MERQHVAEILRSAGPNVRTQSARLFQFLTAKGLAGHARRRHCQAQWCGREEVGCVEFGPSRSITLTLAAARVLRHLATNHIFREVAPDYFKHNMISSVLDTGKDVSAIQRECVFQTS